MMSGGTNKRRTVGELLKRKTWTGFTIID